MVEKIDHLGIAVKNLEEAVKFYEEVLGLTCSGVEEVPEQKVKVAFFPLGETKLELLQSTSPEGPVAKFIEAKGEGIHHMALRVCGLEDKMQEIEEKGARLIDKTPRYGAGKARIAFVHPKSTGGILLELCERDK